MKHGLTKPRIDTATRRQIYKLIAELNATIGATTDTTINQAPSDLFASPLARRRPPAVTPAVMTAPTKPKEDPALRNLNRLIVKLLVDGKAPC
jgi:hypothetical protein